MLSKSHEKRLWKSCMEEAYTLTEKEMPLRIFFNKLLLILNNSYDIFWILRHTLQKSFKWFILLSTRLHADILLRIWPYIEDPESLDVLEWNFLTSFMTSKLHLSIASANVQMTYLRLRELETDGQPWKFSKYILLIKEVEWSRHNWIL